MANEGMKLDKLLDALDGMAKRLDALEARPADAAKSRRAKADAEAKGKGENYVPPLAGDRDDPFKRYGDPQQTAADDNKGTTSMNDLPEKILRAKAIRDELYALENEVKRDMKVQGPLCEQEETAMADCQARADAAYSELGKRAPRPMTGERLAQYRVRLLQPLKSHSMTWKDVNLADHSGKNLDVIEKQIYADAIAYADSAENCPSSGEIIATQKRDDSGRMITTFKGRRSFVNAFKGAAYRATIRDPREIRLREILQRGDA